MAASKNIQQIFLANPITSILTADLLYVGRGSVDSAIEGNKLYTAPTLNASFNTLALNATSNQITLKSLTNTLTISAANQSLGSFVYSIPNAGANANFVMTEGDNVTINGTKTFSADTRMFRSEPGGDVIFLVENNSTSTGSNTYCNVYVNNSGTGDAVYRCGHQSAQHYSWGFDNSDSDAFVFSVGDTLGTSNAMRCSTAGSFTFFNALTVNADISQTISTNATDLTFTTYNSAGTGPTKVGHQILANNSHSGTQAYVKFGHISSQQYTIGWTRVDNNFQLSVGGTLGTSNAWTVDQNGNITTPLQTRFYATKTGDTPNQTGNGAAATIIFDNIVSQVGGSNYSNSTGIFTAPVAGTWQFETTVYVGDITAAMTSFILGFGLNSTGITHFTELFNGGTVRDYQDQIIINTNKIISLNANDTVQVILIILNGAGDTATVKGSGLFDVCSFSGILVA